MFGISKLIGKLDAALHEVAVNTSTQQMLQVVLAEYNALRAEIQNRSNIQSTLLQLHLTALTLILGGALSEKLGPWIIFLIPFESTIFGLWWLDHSLVIMEIGTYIRESVEPRVSELLNVERAMYWEANFKEGVVAPKRKRIVTFNWLILFSFAGPSFISLIYTMITIAISFLIMGHFLSLELSSGFTPIYSSWETWVATLFWMVDLGFVITYLSLSSYRKKHDYMLDAATSKHIQSGAGT